MAITKKTREEIKKIRKQIRELIRRVRSDRQIIILLRKDLRILMIKR